MSNEKKLALDLRFHPVDHDPWIAIPDARALESWSVEDEIKYNQMNRFEAISSIYVQAFDFIKTNTVPGDYFEFGSHRCRTFRLALTEARRQNMENMSFLSFDSFEGFPAVDGDVQVDTIAEGQLCTPEADFLKMVETHGLFVERVRTIKGFYSDSLTGDLRDELKAQGHVAAMVTIDCDLFESVRDALNFVDAFLQEGTILYVRGIFAGFRGSPRKTAAAALSEYQERSGFQLAEFLNIGWEGCSYVVYR